MSTVQKSLRMPEETIKEIETLAVASKKDFTATTNELLKEAIKAHHCPGIVFTEGVSGKRARFAGTGLEVWEVIATFKGVNEDLKRLIVSFHWLTKQQLLSAIGHYRRYADEIDAPIVDNEGLTPEATQKKYPFLMESR